MRKILTTTDSVTGTVLRSALMLVRTAAGIAGLAAEWDALAGRVPGHSFSQTAHFAGVSLDRAAALQRQSFVITVHKADRLVGIWSLVRRRRGLHDLLEPVSCGTYEEMSGPLIDPDHAGDVARELVALALSIRADRTCFYNLPHLGAVDRTLQQLNRFQQIDMDQSYLVDRTLFPDWPSVEANLSKSFRSQLRRYEQKLSERGALEFGWSRTADDADRVLDFILQTKRTWLEKRALKSHWLNNDETRDFFRALFRAPGFGQNPVIGWIKLNGNPIAGGIYIPTDTCVEALVTTFDPAYSDVSCGNLLVKHGICLSLASGRDYDIGLGFAEYKERWPATRRFYTTRIVKRSLGGLIPTRPEASRMARGWKALLTRGNVPKP